MTARAHRFRVDECGDVCGACVFVRFCFAGLCVCVVVVVGVELAVLGDGGAPLVRTRGIAEDDDVTWLLPFFLLRNFALVFVPLSPKQINIIEMASNFKMSVCCSDILLGGIAVGPRCWRIGGTSGER